MNYRVDISIPALQDAETGFLWIRQFSRDAAKMWYEGLLEAVFSLEENPQRGNIAKESEFIERELRQLIYGKKTQMYKIYFEIREAEKIVRVYRIWHTSKESLGKEAAEKGKAT
jgi:plasmid stabilization system protein ParE